MRSACRQAGKCEGAFDGDGSRAINDGAVAELAGVVESPAVGGTRRRQAAAVRATRADASEGETTGDGDRRRRACRSAIAELPHAIVAPAVGDSRRCQSALVAGAAGGE